MRSGIRGFLAWIGYLLLAAVAVAQVGNSGSIEGVVKDQSGAVVPGATIEISNPVSGYARTINSGTD